MRMLRWSVFFLTVTGLLFVISCNRVKPEKGIKPDQDNGGLKLPAGFSALVVADTLGSGRHLAVRSNGDVYLALRSLKNGKGIAALRDRDGDGRADIISYFSNTLTTGMDIDSNYLYFSNFSEVYRNHLQRDELVPEGTPEVIATGFPEQSQHEDKSFALDGHGNLYVNVGAPSNACQVTDRTAGSPGMDPCPQLERHAGIWKFKSDVLNQSQMVEGHRYASGIRNSIAIAWNPFNDKLYVVQHVISPADAIYRPMGLAQGPDGSIYVSDSEKGRIWRIIYTGK